MSIFSKVFGQSEYSKDEYKKASELIGSTQAYAASCFIPLLDNFPSLEIVPQLGLLNTWDHAITVTCVSAAFQGASIHISSSTGVVDKGILYAIQAVLNRWHENAYAEMCKAVKQAADIASASQTDEEVRNVQGIVFFSLLSDLCSNNPQTDSLKEDKNLVLAIGTPISETFMKWWNP